jgi:hypothetical protein
MGHPKTFADFMRDKYDDIKVDGKSITRLQQVIHLAVRACRMI